jgi:hypothetical protein
MCQCELRRLVFFSWLFVICGRKGVTGSWGVNTAQWRQVDLQTQLQTTRLDAEGADRRCFGIEQSIFAAPHTRRIRLLSDIAVAGLCTNLTDRSIWAERKQQLAARNAARLWTR